MSTSPIIITVAMRKEAEALCHYVSHRTMATELAPFTAWHGTVGDQPVVVLETGIGKTNAASALTWALSRIPNPIAVLNIGVSGGLAPDSQIGDYYVANQLVYHDVWCGEGNQKGQVQGLPPFFSSHDALLAQILELNPHYPVKQGTFCCGDTFIPASEELQKVIEMFPNCCAVDMESTALAHVCFLLQVPFVSLRIVSDTPLTADPHEEQYARFWQQSPHLAFRIIEPIMALLSNHHS